MSTELAPPAADQALVHAAVAFLNRATHASGLLLRSPPNVPASHRSVAQPVADLTPGA